MVHRLTAIGTPPLLLVAITLLLVHHQSLILETFWDGALPAVWQHFFFLLPLLLALVGVGVGLRLNSCGALIMMLTLAGVVGMLGPDGVFGKLLTDRLNGEADRILQLLPLNYLLGLWVLRHSWRSRRGMLALGGVLLWTGVIYFNPFKEFYTVSITKITSGLAWRHVDLTGQLIFWGEAIPVACIIAVMLVHAVRMYEPVSAGLSASLLLMLPPILKDHSGLSLALVLSAAVLVVLVGLLESMVTLAYRDGLTGLPGRRGLNEVLRQLGRRYAIAMLDVDHFKRFNDRFGHRTGDDVLKMIAARMLRIPGGRAFRYGGEEFAVVFSGRSAPKAFERMEDFREALSQTPFVIRRRPRTSKKAHRCKTTGVSSRQQVRITVSVGVATPTAGRKKALDVMSAADKALYQAKRSGRNRVVARK